MEGTFCSINCMIQDVSLEERIAVLENSRREDYREKWAYELAYLLIESDWRKADA